MGTKANRGAGSTGKKEVLSMSREYCGGDRVRTEFTSRDRLLTMAQVREVVPFSKVHLYRLIQRGEFPRQVHLAERRVAWIESEVMAWVAERAAAREVS